MQTEHAQMKPYAGISLVTNKRHQIQLYVGISFVTNKRKTSNTALYWYIFDYK